MHQWKYDSSYFNTYRRQKINTYYNMYSKGANCEVVMWLYIWSNRNRKALNVDVGLKFFKNWVQHGIGTSENKDINSYIHDPVEGALRNPGCKQYNTLHLLWLFLHNVVDTIFRFIFQRIKRWHLKKGIEGLGLFFKLFVFFFFLPSPLILKIHRLSSAIHCQNN